MIHALLHGWVLLAPNAHGTLEALTQCYDVLDYTCAETHLAEVFAQQPTAGQAVSARHYEALLALAFRDDARMRRAVRAIYAIDPTYLAHADPPKLMAAFAELRPMPSPPLRLLVRLDGNSFTTVGTDAQRWSDGLGGTAELGVLLEDRLSLSGQINYSDHRPKLLVEHSLTLWSGGLGVGLRLPLGPIRVRSGLTVGAAHIAIDGVLNDPNYWMGWVGLPLDLSWPVYQHWGVGLHVEAQLLATPSADQLATTLLFPISFGLRYGL